MATYSGDAPRLVLPGDDDTAFLGHPRGLAFLAFTQMWERFSFYGMQALLALYMIHRLLLPGHVEGVIGFAGFRGVLAGVFGPMTTLALASQIFGLYTGFTSLTPLLGAWLADRVFGQRLTTVFGLILMAAGHLLMASEAAFLFALALLVLGAGFMKGTIYAQVGNLYAGGDSRRTRAFSIFLIALNIGAFLAPLVCGTLGEVYGWHYGFGVAGIGMLVGLATYVAGWRYLPPDRRRGRVAAAAFDRSDWRAITAIGLLVLPVIPLYVAAYQAYNLVIVWAETHMDRKLFGRTFPVTWLLTLDGLMTIVGVGLTIPIWRWLAARRREPDTLHKFAIASVLVTMSYVVLAAGSALGPLVPVAIVALFFVVLDVSYGWSDPPTNAFVARFAPASAVTMMMSLMLMVVGGLPNIIVGWLGRFYEPLGPTQFWLLHAGLAATGGVLALGLRPVIRHLLAGHAEGTI